MRSRTIDSCLKKWMLPVLGGAAGWQNEVIDADYLERYIYDSEDLKFLEQVESASMGETETLADFLAFCRDNYPADHTAVNEKTKNRFYEDMLRAYS